MIRHAVFALVLTPAAASATPWQPRSTAHVRESDRPVAEIAASQTIDNLHAAINGEANAEYRYSELADQAEREAYDEVAMLFRAAALAASIHRRNHEAVLRGLGVEPRAPTRDPIEVGTTRDNLEEQLRDDAREAAPTYPAFVVQAHRDHLPAAVRSFTYAMNTQAACARLFRDALATLDEHPPVTYFVGLISGDTVTEVPSDAWEGYLEVE